MMKYTPIDKLLSYQRLSLHAMNLITGGTGEGSTGNNGGGTNEAEEPPPIWIDPDDQN